MLEPISKPAKWFGTEVGTCIGVSVEETQVVEMVDEGSQPSKRALARVVPGKYPTFAATNAGT